MRSRGWSLTHHKYWQRRDNLDSIKHIRNPKSEENCMCVSTHTLHRCIKKRIKRSLKISFSNKRHILQQIYSGKYGDSESRFLTLHHLPAGKTNWFGKHTSCSVNLCWNMQSWECAGGFTAVTCRQANIALSQSQPLQHYNFCHYSDLCFTGFGHNCVFPCKSVLQVPSSQSRPGGKAAVQSIIL